MNSTSFKIHIRNFIIIVYIKIYLREKLDTTDNFLYSIYVKIYIKAFFLNSSSLNSTFFKINMRDIIMCMIKFNFFIIKLYLLNI